MSRQASPTAIGVFVLGALALLLVGVLVFGSGKFFADTIRVVMYFQGDLNGLDTGASVKFEGVPLGTVTDFGVVLDPHDLSARIPVVVEIRRDHLRIKGNESAAPTSGQALKPMVEQKGLRAQLQSESLVTGQQFIQRGRGQRNAQCGAVAQALVTQRGRHLRRRCLCLCRLAPSRPHPQAPSYPPAATLS